MSPPKYISLTFSQANTKGQTVPVLSATCSHFRTGLRLPNPYLPIRQGHYLSSINSEIPRRPQEKSWRSPQRLVMPKMHPIEFAKYMQIKSNTMSREKLSQSPANGPSIRKRTSPYPPPEYGLTAASTSPTTATRAPCSKPAAWAQSCS